MHSVNHSLKAIADALGIPVEVFSGRIELTDKGLIRMREAAELLEAFEQLTSPQARRRCISYAKALSQRSV